MSDIGGGAGGALDLPFVLLEIAFALLWIVGVLRGRDLPAPLHGVAAPLGIFVTLGLPILWNLLSPPQGGIEGAARFLFGGACSSVNLVLSSIYLVRAARRLSPEGPTPVAFLVGHAVGVAGYWALFLFT